MEDEHKLNTPVIPWLALTLAQAVSPKLCSDLRNWHRDPSVLRQAVERIQSGNHDPDCPLTPNHLDAISHPKTADRISEALAWQSRSEQHHLLGLDHPLYPALLRELPEAPPILYAIGDLQALDGPCLGIVGSRKASHIGSRSAFQFASDLASAGLAITSGLAIGIDAAAHRGALNANGLTIAVAATDPAHVYPKQHRGLNQEIIDTGGLVIHEFPLGTPVRPWCFPQRNRIISGLAHGVLVVEAALPSGSLTTARHALEQGREVMALPGTIHHREARGCHALIKDGAALVENRDDVLSCLGAELWSSMTTKTTKTSIQTQLFEQSSHHPGTIAPTLSVDERSVLEQMTSEHISVDNLHQATGLPIAKLSATLGTMELKNLIMPVAGGRYTRVKP